MKGSLKIWLVILGILVMGSATTFLTYSYVTNQRKNMKVTADNGHSNITAAGNAAEERDADSGIEEVALADIAIDASDHEKKLKVQIEEQIIEAEGDDLQTQLEEYRKRLPELDRQIEQMRISEVDNFVYSVKNAAQTERRIWERELEGIYGLLLEFLDETSVQELKEEQSRWEQLRDSRAQEAGKKNSGGSMESVDYIASVAASARERAYQLLEKYQE